VSYLWLFIVASEGSNSQPLEKNGTHTKRIELSLFFENDNKRD